MKKLLYLFIACLFLVSCAGGDTGDDEGVVDEAQEIAVQAADDLEVISNEAEQMEMELIKQTEDLESALDSLLNDI